MDRADAFAFGFIGGFPIALEACLSGLPLSSEFGTLEACSASPEVAVDEDGAAEIDRAFTAPFPFAHNPLAFLAFSGMRSWLVLDRTDLVEVMLEFEVPRTAPV